MSFQFNITGSSGRIRKALEKMANLDVTSILDRYGAMGVQHLSSATPVDTGKTASAWTHETKRTSSGYSIEFRNSNINKYVNIAVILQTGHGTGTGGYVQGIDYINPAMRPVFESLANDLYQELTR